MLSNLSRKECSIPRILNSNVILCLYQLSLTILFILIYSFTLVIIHYTYTFHKNTQKIVSAEWRRKLFNSGGSCHFWTAFAYIYGFWSSKTTFNLQSYSDSKFLKLTHCIQCGRRENFTLLLLKEKWYKVKLVGSENSLSKASLLLKIDKTVKN